jgi:hypothetical protein
MPRSQSGISIRSRRSITTSQKSNSKNSVDEEAMLSIAAELHDLPEGSESGDSETATEVDVSSSFLFLSSPATHIISLLTRFVKRSPRRLQSSKSTPKAETS